MRTKAKSLVLDLHDGTLVSENDTLALDCMKASLYIEVHTELRQFSFFTCRCCVHLFCNACKVGTNLRLLTSR